MDVFKKLMEVKRSVNGHVADPDNDDDGIFCYHQHVEEEELKPPNFHRPPALVTSSKFDSDETFTIIAQNMIYRYENENMSVREAIDATLIESEDKRAFLEAIDLKYASMPAFADELDGSGESETSPEFCETVLQTRSIFAATLRSMWKESVLKDSANAERTNIFAQMVEDHENETDVDLANEEYYRRPPKTPKNLCLSPIKCVYDCQKSLGSSDKNMLSTPLKRRRRWFFSDTNTDFRNTASIISGAMPFKKTRSEEKRFDFVSKSSIGNPFVLGSSYPNFRFDLGGPLSNKKAVQSLQLDRDIKPTSGPSTYMPPTSPIRKVSVEMRGNE